MPTASRDPIVINELQQAWEGHADRLKRRRAEVARATVNGRPLPPQLERELREIDDQLAQRVDPLMRRVWDALKIGPPLPEAGLMPSQQGATPSEKLARAELRAMAVYWMLVQTGHTDPTASDFERQANRRRIEFDGAATRYEEVAQAEAGDERRLAWAETHEIVNELVAQGQSPSKENIKSASEAVSQRQRHRHKHHLALDDITADATVDLIADHLRAAAVVHAHDRLARAGIFDAVDQIVEDADCGRIEIGRRAIERIEDYRRDSLYRFLDPERLQALRSRLLGPPFPRLWRNLVTATHDFVARLTPVDLVGSRIPTRISEEPVRVSAVELATHLSQGGWGTTYAAAEALQRQIVEARRILRADSIVRSYRSRDWVGVVVHAADVEVGDLMRELELAESGTTVISWLAVNAEDLENEQPLLDIDLYEGDDPLENPTDGDFATACEQIYQLLGYGQTPVPVDEEEPDGDADEDEGEGEGAYAGHGGYDRPAAVTLKPSMFPNGGGQ